MAGKVIKLGKEDYLTKTYKTAPSGTYKVQFVYKNSKIKPSKNGKGQNLNLNAKITEGPHKDITFFDVIGDSVTWKIGQLLAAIATKKDSITLEQLNKLLGGKTVRAILRIDMFQGKKSNKVVQWLPLKPGKNEEAAEVEQEEPEEGEEPEAEEPEEPEAEEAEEVDLEAMDRSELKALIGQQSLDIKVTKSMTDDDIRAAITEAVGGGEEPEPEEPEDEPEEPEEPEEGEDEEVDLNALDRSALKAFIKEKGLNVTVTKGMSDDDIRDAILAELGGGEEPEEPEPEDEPEEKPTRKPKPAAKKPVVKKPAGKKKK